MILFSLDDINSEKDAEKAVEELTKEAIEAKTALRGKMGKIRRVQSKIRKLTMYCTSKGWKLPLKKLKQTFTSLEDEAGAHEVNLFQI